MRGLLIGLCAVTMLLCCTEKTQTTPVDDETRAGGVALECYRALYIQNQPEAFLRGRVVFDSLDEEQRQQLITFYKQHVLKVERQRGAVRNIDFSRAELDTALNVMQVFLKMTYGDATQEEIVVPMVERDGEWRME